MAERQAKKLADEILKQKAEEKAAHEKVREQIRRDKAEKAARYEREKQQKQQVIEQKKAEKVAAEAKIKEKKERWFLLTSEFLHVKIKACKNLRKPTPVHCRPIKHENNALPLLVIWKEL